MQTSFDLINNEKERYQDYLGKAALFHFVLLLFLWGTSKIFSLISSTPDKDNFLYIEKTIRVDVVAMPKETLQELKNATIGEIPEQEEKRAKEVPSPPAEDDYLKIKKGFLSTIKDLSKRKVGLENKKGEKSSAIDKSKLEGLILSGNRLADGNSVTGKEGSDGDLSRYLSSLPDLIRPHWRLPSYLIGKDLQCRIRVFLNTNGELVKGEIFESSGVDEYDKKALSAVRAASPFGPVPKEILSRALRGEILLGFPL